MFVIAKVNGRYRTLCVIHDPRLSGPIALKACIRTLNIFGDPANRIPLEQELIAAQRHDESFWSSSKKKSSQKDIHVPFPFIATCLIIGTSFDPYGYYSSVQIERYSMAYNEGDNSYGKKVHEHAMYGGQAVTRRLNVFVRTCGQHLPVHRLDKTISLIVVLFLGITIFDITEPSNIRHCFVDFHGMDSERPVQLMTPLTARIYFDAYCDPADPGYDQFLFTLIHELDGRDTIPVGTLQDTWPVGEWKESEYDNGGSDEISFPELGEMEIRTPSTPKSLRDGAMAAVLQTLLDGSDEDTGLSSEVELLTDFLPKLKGKLYEDASIVKPLPQLLDLLCRALEEDTDVDLSPFGSFSAKDMSLVVSRLQNHGKMNTLCISNRPDLTDEDLQIVLRGATGLKALYILEDPQIAVHGISTLLDNCDVYHSDLLRRQLKRQPEGFCTSIDLESSGGAIPGSQVCRANRVSQLVWIGITDPEESCRLESGLIDWRSLTQEKRQIIFHWSESCLRYRRYLLGMPLPIFKTVVGLLRQIKWISSIGLYLWDRKPLWRCLSYSFSMASCIPGGNDIGINAVGSGNGFGIGPSGATLYLDDIDERNRPSDVHERLGPDQWAIILIHKTLDGEAWDTIVGDTKELRYALATPSTKLNPSDHQFVVADIPTYLEHIIGDRPDKGNNGDLRKLIEVWNSQIAAMPNVDFYKEDDVHDILSTVFPSQKAILSGFKSE